MILSTAFLCLSTMQFFLLRLDRFSQFLYTSSVIISLQFVLLISAWKISDDLLSLSVQESPNLFAFRVLSLNFVTFYNGLPRSIVTFVTVHNGLPRSILRHWRRQTRWQAFSFGVIDLSSECVEEHLTDCGVVVIHVFGKPLLGHGLLIELDVSLREEVAIGS